jgi:hypothetical protein
VSSPTVKLQFQPFSLARRPMDMHHRKFEDVGRDVEQATVLVLVY